MGLSLYYFYPDSGDSMTILYTILRVCFYTLLGIVGLVAAVVLAMVNGCRITR